MQAIMLAFACRQPYHALRAAAAAGYKVHVLGRDAACGLKYSRYCSSYRHFDFDPITQSLDVALAEINRRVKDISADIILPSDIVSTRILAALTDRLPAATCALPDSECFDMLNDKWRFYKFCKDQNVRVPQTWLFEDKAALEAAVAEGTVPFPFIIKPLDSSGGFGIHRMMEKSDLKVVDEVKYKPLLVQKLIIGDEIDISILANKGRVDAYAIQRNLPKKYVFMRHDPLLALASRVVEASGLHGLAHFDAIIEKTTGEVYLIECNPRVWYSLFAAVVAGLNFVKMSLNLESLEPANPRCVVDKVVDNCGSTVGLFKRLVRELSTNKPDWNLLRYNLADPIGKKVACQDKFDVVSFVQTGAGPVEYQVAALAAIRAMTVPV